MLAIASHFASTFSMRHAPYVTGLILDLRPANERWRYFVTTSLIGARYVHTYAYDASTWDANTGIRMRCESMRCERMRRDGNARIRM